MGHVHIRNFGTQHVMASWHVRKCGTKARRHVTCHDTLAREEIWHVERILVRLGPVYRILFSIHIGLASCLHDAVFISYRIGFISDWPSVYKRTHQSDMLPTVFAFSNESVLKVAGNQSDMK